MHEVFLLLLVFFFLRGVTSKIIFHKKESYHCIRHTQQSSRNSEMTAEYVQKRTSRVEVMVHFYASLRELHQSSNIMEADYCTSYFIPGLSILAD